MAPHTWAAWWASLLLLLAWLALPSRAGEPLYLQVGQHRPVYRGGPELKLLSLAADRARVEFEGRPLDLEKGKRKRVGDYLLELEGASARGADFRVLLRPEEKRALAFVESFGWHVDRELAPVDFEVSSSLTGLPATHYQSASQALGMGLDELKGRKVKLRVLLMTEKTGEGCAVRAYLAVFEGFIHAGWVATDAPVAPGVLPLSDTRTISRW